MPDIIQLLPDNVANQIAAGEVIPRPASAVKELLENAIDAQATEIKLVVKDAGKTLIQVIDNGIGMSLTDARLAFERHATSKIRSAEDLYSLHTKGFRGEALASIAAVAQVELITKQADSEIGTQVKIEGNKVTSQEPCVAQKGTSISMKNLFFNTPARRNFLKSDNVEFRFILDEFHRVVLAHPEVHFYLYNNGNEVFNLPKTNLRQRIVHVFGSKINDRLVPLQEETELFSISGFICKPSAKKNKNNQYFIVNDRFIKSRYLHHAIVTAYEGLLKETEQPEYFLYLKLDPKTIDINIHPTKTEIKFENEQTIYALLKSVVKHSLGQFQVMPTLDFSLNQDYQTPYHYKDKEVKIPTIQVDSNFNPFTMDYPLSSPKAKISSSQSSKNTSSWESIYTGIPSRVNFDEFQSVQNQEFQPPLFEDKSMVDSSVYTILYFQKKYLITYLKEKVFIIHINRAHQRVLYEQFMEHISANKIISQQLLFPLEFEFSSTEIIAIETLREALESMGFILEIKDRRVHILGIPTNFRESSVQEMLFDLISTELNQIPQDDTSQKEMLAKSLAKSLAIRTGQTLVQEAQHQLVKDLFSCQEPLLSPFQKKIYVELSINDIDNKLN